MPFIKRQGIAALLNRGFWIHPLLVDAAPAESTVPAGDASPIATPSHC